MWPFKKKTKIGAGDKSDGVEILSSTEASALNDLRMITMDDLTAFHSQGLTPSIFQNFDGNKFYNGYGLTDIQIIDYWALRQKSLSLFTTNLYGRGIIRRYVTNVINDGLTLESQVENSIIGMSDDAAAEWTENVENRFNLWASNPNLCDYKQRVEGEFGEIQAEAYQSALVGGDVLVVIRFSQKYNLPYIQLIPGEAVVMPLVEQKNTKIIHGVELDSRNRQVAYWVRQEDGTVIRMAAVGARTGRRKAFLLYGTDKRMDEVRGQPLLALILQSIKEIDRYRDSVQRKALINSYLAMFIKKDQPVLGTAPMTGGAVRVDNITTAGGQAGITDGTGTRTVPVTQHIPGMVMQELAPGETPVAFDSSGSNLDFGPFEATIINGMAWALEMPPEILTLAFTNNYSASQAAINEYKMFLNRTRRGIGRGLCKPIFAEWFTAEIVLGKIVANGYLEAVRDPKQYDIATAWLLSDWTGAIKPSTDIKKQAQGHEIMVDRGWITNARSSRELTGTKFSKNIKTIEKENIQKAAALRPLLELEQEFGADNTRQAESELDNVRNGTGAKTILSEMAAMAARIDELEEVLIDG